MNKKVVNEAERIFGKDKGRVGLGDCSMQGYDGFIFGAAFQSEQSAAEIEALRLEKAELLTLLTEIHTTSPVGSQFNPWIDTRAKLRKTLERYGLI